LEPEIDVVCGIPVERILLAIGLITSLLIRFVDEARIK
jgi:hypothetical protein